MDKPTDNRKKLQDQEARDGYYRVAEGIHMLAEVAAIEEDATLAALQIRMQKAVDATKRHLDKNYIWD